MFYLLFLHRTETQFSECLVNKTENALTAQLITMMSVKYHKKNYSGSDRVSASVHFTGVSISFNHDHKDHN